MVDSAFLSEALRTVFSSERLHIGDIGNVLGYSGAIHTGIDKLQWNFDQKSMIMIQG